MRRAFLLFALGLIFLGVFSSFANAQVSSFASSVAHQPRASFQSVYGTDDRLTTYWPILGDKDSCLARQDLLLQVSPGGCQPSVVRSDLLAEQNVPVFCQIDALQINPLIDIEQIRSISFSSKYPKDVIGAGFHPARAALRSRDKLLGSPLINNIGYVVVVLKKNPAEKDLPDIVKVNLSARIDYEAENSFGVGRAEFILSPTSDSDWEQTDERFRNSFWNGRYFARLEQADPNFAVVSLYSGQKGLLGGIGKIATVRVERGKTSGPIYVPGAYCRAGLEVAYDGFISAENMATIVISDDKGTDSLDVYEGSRFLNDKCSVNKIVIDEGNNTGAVSINCLNEKRHDLILRSNFSNVTGGRLQDKDLGDLSNNFNEAIASLERVADEYSAEKERNVEGAESYGERALIRAIELSLSAGKEATRVRLMSKFVERYPDSSFTEYRNELNRIVGIDFSDSTDVLNIDNKFWNVRLVQLKKPRKQSIVELSITGANAETAKINLKELKNFSGGIGSVESIRIDNIVNEEEVAISANCRVSEEGGKFSIKGSSFRLKLFDDAIKICDKSFAKLRDVSLERNAKIRLLPKSQGTRTETNLSINIGIEKRAIKLSPEKTEELIENLNKSVKRWEEINNNLGKVVEGLKGACFATSAVLTVTNFLTGIGGEALARQKVMVGWTRQCSDLVSKGDYPTINACYLAKANEIDNDVKAANEAINGINNRIDGIEKNSLQKGSGLTADSVDRSKAAVDYCNDLKNRYGERDVKTSQGVMKLKDVLGDCEKGYNEQGLYGYNELREMEYNLLMQEKGASEHIKKNSGVLLESSYAQVLNNKERYADVQKAQEARALGLPAPIVATSSVRKNVVGEIVAVSGVKDTIIKPLIPSTNTHLAGINVYDSRGTTINNVKREGFVGGNYYLGLAKDPQEGGYVVQDVFRKIDKGYDVLSSEKRAEFLDIYGVGRITSAETVSYVNSYKNPEVRYYETEPYKGMPAIVPFDVQSGWYAATRQTLPTFGGIGAFDASGRVTSFYLCNVGPNGNEQFFEGYGDDICQLINLNTGQPLGFFPGLSEQEARRRVGEAVLAIQDAANQFGKKRVSIRGKEFFVGRPAANIPSTQCQNFMSPEECHLLFNVCDPVICPSSRCDFGGKYPVADVVQTGIIGSTLLCLPNVREKIIVPVCLTGIHAGIDSFVSILKNHRDCLQENLATGKSVGICDQIYSVYLCEFFWRQAAPVAKVVLPKIIESAYGQGTRGGGEYLTVSAAWENTQNSINYFTQSYAVNSINAFKVRSIEEAGTPICKAFVSVKAPTSFKTLVEPDSPPQFHAWFSATRYTDATVPATSQYKVFYHIFAGKDQGVQYSVYLKNPPESSYFTLPAVVHVASGFVGRGQYSSESRDFTAPEGYKELCVRVNNVEECGFKQVSTSFALNYLRDSYVSEELKESKIKSEKECVSGSSNLGASVLNPNLQAGAEESLLPSAYERGIVRICSSQNPGSQTDPTRFVEMGYCDDQKIKCWLDKNSVTNAITDNNVGLRNATLSEIETRQRADLAQKGVIVGDDDAVAEIKQLKEVVDGLRGREGISERDVNETVIRLNELFKRVVLNHHKANVLYLIGDLRAIYVERGINSLKILRAVENASERIVDDVRTDEVGGTGGEVKYLLSGEYNENEVINIIQRKDGSDRVFLSIDKGRVYTLTPRILIGNVQQISELDFSVNLLNSNSFDEFYNFIRGEDSGISRELAVQYYTFRNAVIKENTVARS